LYEYQCVKCHRRTEKIESVSGPHLKKCPHCGGKVERLLATPAIQFKGSGWYVTDYAGRGGGAEKGEAKESPAKEPASKDTKDSKGTKEKKVTKKE
jgi:putative FmdB family regulatory protein